MIQFPQLLADEHSSFIKGGPERIKTIAITLACVHEAAQYLAFSEFGLALMLPRHLCKLALRDFNWNKQNDTHILLPAEHIFA